LRCKNAPRLIQINAWWPFSWQSAGMEPDFAILDDSEIPVCSSCGKPMRFVRSIPRFAALPELRTYECKPCGVTYTAAVAPGDDADAARVERPENCGPAWPR
jgi:hypothetical protein